ncbi:MAG: hypothetical protein WAP07_01250 [Acutalibacteraceae bacterium]
MNEKPKSQKPKKKGRPTKLTKELIEQIATLVRAGNYIETACNFVGISKDTYFRWAREGARAKSGLKRLFSDSIKSAVAESEIRDVEFIRKNETWQSKAWRLERRFPDRWGNRQKVELSGNVEIERIRKLAEEIMNENDS